MLTREKILQIPKMRKEGLTNSEIAEKLGTSEPSVIRWVKRLRESGHNVPPRTGGTKRIEL